MRSLHHYKVILNYSCLFFPPLQCEKCDLHFRHKSQLRLHLRQKHGAVTNTKAQYRRTPSNGMTTTVSSCWAHRMSAVMWTSTYDRVSFFFFEQSILVYAFCIRCTLLHVGFFVFCFGILRLYKTALWLWMSNNKNVHFQMWISALVSEENVAIEGRSSLSSALRITVTVLLQIEFELSFPDNVVIVYVVVLTWAVVVSDDWYYQIAICWQDMSIFFSSLTVSNWRGPYVWLVPVCGTYCYMYRLF